LLDFVLALVLLAAIVRVLGPIEDWAMRLGRKPALARVVESPEEMRTAA
jgi:hypothetical protein